MKSRHATTNYKMIAPFLEVVDKHEGYAKFTATGYMDLSIEELWYSDPFDNPVYSIAHWGEMNGDAMRDPEITFGVNKDKGEILPLSYQNDFAFGYYSEVFFENDGKWLCRRKTLSSIDDFLNMWLKNIAEQGFSPDKTKEIEGV